MTENHPIVWITGQPGAGKSTLSRALIAHWQTGGKRCFLVDGDDLRGLTANADYSRAGCEANIRRAQDIALYLAGQGCHVVVAVVAPYRSLRENFKAHTNVCEVFVHTHEVRGRENFHNADYEPPLDRFVDMDTTACSPEKSLAVLIDALKSQNA
jgi:adenylylsulfate kinase-like enzyme